MKLKTAVLLSAVLMCLCIFQSEASAANGRWRARRMQVRAAGRTTLIPTREELALPRPGQGRLVRYAINLYPTARLVRIVLGR